MSEAPGAQGQQGGKRTQQHFFPPYPYLTIKLDSGTLLFVPQSSTTHALERFQINPHGLMSGGAGAFQLATLTPADWEAVWSIRLFYNDWQHSGASRLRDPQIIAWLQAQVRDGGLTAFWLPAEGDLGQMVVNPAEVAPVPPPATQAVVQWSIRHKIIAMFQAVPSHLSGAAKAQFEAFLTPENLALLAGFFVLVAAVQAAPGADAVVDAILTGLAWAMYGWAGLVATRDLVQAVIGAARAKSQADIDQAAQEAASAVVVLGVTLFLKKLADRVKVDNGSPPKAADPGTAPARSSSFPAPAAAKPDPFLPKKTGVTEPGAIPMTPALQAQMNAAKLRGTMTAPGYPDLPADAAQTFGADPIPWDGDSGGSISRIIGTPDAANGSYWVEGSPPATEEEWRAGAAVQNNWNGDGAYVTSPSDGLQGWIGPAAPQASSDGVNVLPGNGMQVWLPRGSASPSAPVPTPWNTGGS